MSTPNYGESCHGKVAPVGDASQRRMKAGFKLIVWGKPYGKKLGVMPIKGGWRLALGYC